MPPKPRFTREEITAAALDLVSEKGLSALTARDLGSRLGSSARPIFTVFKSMEEVQQAVRRAAKERFDSYAQRAMCYAPAFKQIGMQALLFAREEPMLYRLLFMEGGGAPRSFEDVFLSGDDLAAASLALLQEDYGLTPDEARALFKHVWIFTFGVGAFCATGVCCFSEEELNELLGQDFMAMLLRIKSGALCRATVRPARKG